MAENRIKLKRSNVTGTVPSTADLELGEIGINTKDGKIFFQKDGGTIQSVVTTNSKTTGSIDISGSLIITGSVSVSGSITGSDNILILGGGLDIKNKGAQSYARFYCESNNFHYTEVKAQPHSLFSGNPIMLLPAYDFDFAKPKFVPSITASADISASGDIFFNPADATTGTSVLTIDPTTGKVFRTGSYSAGSSTGDSEWFDGGTFITSSKDVQITGSLVISGSFNAFRIDSDDIILGNEAGLNVSSVGPSYNVFIGERAGKFVTTGGSNVIIGREAGTLANQGRNTSIGYLAGRGWNSTAGENVSIGYYSAYNAAVGTAAGTHNTLLGAFTGRNLTNGTGNVYIGHSAGFNGTNSTGNIIIGSGSLGTGTYNVSINNQLRIGNGTNHIISGSLETGDLILQNTTVTSLTSSGDISSSANIIANNITASNAFHAQAHSGFEFTISGSQFNMINETPDKNLFFKTTTGTGTINFGTNNVDSEVIIGTGGNITASGNISGSGELYFSSSLDSNTGYRTVVVDPATGKLYRTGSYGGGGGAGGENYDLNATTATSTTTAANINLTSTSGTDDSVVKIEAGPNITIARNSANEIAISGSSITAFPFTGDAEITGSLEITGTPGSTIFTVDGRSFFKDQVTFGNNIASDVVSFGARVSTNIEPVALGSNNERLGTDAKPWYGATITTITSSHVLINETSSLRESNAGNLLLFGSDASWQGLEFGRDTGQPSKFRGAINATSDITASGDISSSADVYLTLSQFGSPTSALNTLVIDPEDGKVYATGSYGGGGGSSPATGLSDATKIFVWYQGMT